jgi:F0F1-type ATP synthase epsilon subunit
MKVIILTARDKLYEDEAREVVLPAEDGEICVLDFHQPFLASLISGNIQILPRYPVPAQESPKNKAEIRLHINSGVAKMFNSTLTILAEVDR